LRCFTSGFIGLGLDTATEIALLGPWVAQTALSISPWIILIFPMLFAAGMTLIDTTDGVMMLNENFSSLGFAAIVVVFLVGWLLSYLIYRIRHVDTFETARYFR
jgi:high-affinity nickel permease